MQNYNSKLKIFENVKTFILDEEETSQESKEIYSFGKSSDSPGSFGIERTRETDSRVISKIF